MPVIIISVAIMLLCGFAATRITRLLRLPNVTAYIITGIVIGPYCLKLIPAQVIEGMAFLSDIALAFIAFGVGQFFRLSKLKKNGGKVIVITVFESLVASLFVFVLTFCILRLGIAFSIVLSALAAATAPASTMMTIRQYVNGDQIKSQEDLEKYMDANDKYTYTIQTITEDETIYLNTLTMNEAYCYLGVKTPKVFIPSIRTYNFLMSSGEKNIHHNYNGFVELLSKMN